ncbi:putative nucleotidyltransferase, ribonuclease H [Tanacetum coccineum]
MRSFRSASSGYSKSLFLVLIVSADEHHFGSHQMLKLSPNVPRRTTVTRLVSAPILTLPSGFGGFQIYSDASKKLGLCFDATCEGSGVYWASYEDRVLTSFYRSKELKGTTVKLGSVFPNGTGTVAKKFMTEVIILHLPIHPGLVGTLRPSVGISFRNLFIIDFYLGVFYTFVEFDLLLGQGHSVSDLYRVAIYTWRDSLIGCFVGKLLLECSEAARHFKWGFKEVGFGIGSLIRKYTLLAWLRTAAQDRGQQEYRVVINQGCLNGVWGRQVGVLIGDARFFGGQGSEGHASVSASQRRSTETLPPPPLVLPMGKPHPGAVYATTRDQAAKTSGLYYRYFSTLDDRNIIVFIRRPSSFTPSLKEELERHSYGIVLEILRLKKLYEKFHGIIMDPSKVEAITKWPRPTTVTEVPGGFRYTVMHRRKVGLCFDATWEGDRLRFKVKIEHQRASGLLQPLEIPMWKWDEISMDFVTGLPTTQKRHDAIWVVVDRLTKSAHFLPIRKNYGISKLAEIFQQEIVRLHGTPTSIVSDRDPKFTSRFWKGLQKAWGTRLKFSTAFHPQTDGQSERTIQTLEDMLRACALEWTGSWDEYLCLVEFAYNNSWHASIKAAPFELLYGRKCRAPICWDEVGERLIEGPELIEITNEKVVVAKEKLKEARSRQKSYADKHRRDLEFQVGDRVFLKVSPFRGVKRFGIKGKLSPRFIGPFEILERIGEVSYRLALPPQLSHVHDVFHVSLLRGYHYHPLHVASYPFDQIQPDMSLSEEPESILDRQERVMRNKVIPFVKILWKNHPEREATWETEESMRASYPHFFV